ncbi:hypothetical protein T06_12496 [Trichinella sp. T6]|nr:hypothetical protein T06_12496 [Trichinella sp. T6]
MWPSLSDPILVARTCCVSAMIKDSSCIKIDTLGLNGVYVSITNCA